MANLRDYGRFLRSGYTLPELAMNFFRLVVWSRLTSALKHPFARRGRGVVIDHTACIQGARFMSVDEGSWLQRHVWFTVPLIELDSPPSKPVLRVGKRVQVGPRCFFSAVNGIEIGDDVLFAPNVYLSDHAHAYEDPGTSVKDQGLTPFGTIRIGRGAWLGINVVVTAVGKDIEIGEGAVIGANSVVNRSIPAHAVAAGNPARVIKRLDAASGKWVPVIPRRRGPA